MFRWCALAVFVTCIALSARRRWHARHVGGAIPRSLEPASLIAGRILIALPLFGGIVAHLVTPDWMGWASFDIPTWVRWIGLALALLVPLWLNWVLSSLGPNISETVLTKERHQLVTTGPYRWVRHPLYVGGIALFVSIGLMLASWFILLWAAIALIAVRTVVIPQEEAQLVAKFGEAYRSYRSRTGALLPATRADERFPVPRGVEHDDDR
jgi:protein-S-isoprenylcysteine O-methyltransferase Ste14